VISYYLNLGYRFLRLLAYDIRNYLLSLKEQINQINELNELDE
jgi:hypothetical protein